MNRAQSSLGAGWDAWRARRYDQNKIASIQSSRLHEMVAFARAYSPYYRELYSGLPSEIRDLRELPPVTKLGLMACFEDWVTDPAITRTGVEAFVADKTLVGTPYLGRYFLCTTSGTTGVPGIFLHDSRATAIYRALMLVRGYLAGTTPRRLRSTMLAGLRVAVLVATGDHFAGFGWLQRVNFNRNRFAMYRFGAFSVMSPVEDLVKALNRFRPTAVVGYPTAAFVLAREQAAGRLRIGPALVVTSGEWLSPVARREIKQAFGCTIRNAYGASECLPIAYDCRCERLHLNSDWVVLEPVDEAFRAVEPGQPSKTALLTNLMNNVQPIIRYDLGDSITLDPNPCPCGSTPPVIRVEGRQDEILYFRAEDRRPVPVLPMAIAAVVEETSGVYRYQIVQSTPATVKVRLEATAGTETTAVWRVVSANLRSYLAAQGLPWVAVERAKEPPQSDPASGKFRQVWAERGFPRYASDTNSIDN
ncbi:MAG: AMP-binding protein [Dehalococcoidia bacterium]|nr:AMP-binding protein [Dehalococcoidia bacterium]